MVGFRKTSAVDSDPTKEVASSTDYGTIKYAPSDPVKRPRNRVYDVLRELNPGQSYSTDKSPGAWNTGIIEFEPAHEETRPFDKLRNELRKEKNQAPMPEKSVSKSKQIWGKALSHYKSKAGKSKFDVVRDQLIQDKPRNSRDISRDSIGPGGSNTSYGQRLGRKKSIQERRRSQRKKMRDLQRALLSDFKKEESRQDKKRRQRDRKGRKKNRRQQSSRFPSNYLLKGK